MPGKAHITNPMGVSQEFTFSTFKAGESSNSGQGVTKRIELLKSSGIVTQTSTCSCYGAKPAGSELTPAMGTSATTNTCQRGDQAWKTLYKATVTGAASGNYYIWTTGTGMDLDPDPGMCSFTSNAKLAIGLSVADGKAACSTAAPTVADASNGAGCEAGSISGSQCAQTCTSGLFASGETSCDDGAWTSTFACSGAKACSASAAGATFNGAVGVIGSNCGFDTADGADCYLGCAEGSGHTGQKVECNDGTWTVTDESVVLPTCVVGVPQATNDGPGSSPAIPRSPTDASIVRTGDAPKCEVVNGHTVVHCEWLARPDDTTRPFPACATARHPPLIRSRLAACSPSSPPALPPADSPSFHPSFKCTHDNGACTCTTHPTSALGGCMEFDHTSGDTVQHGGDCITQDKKWKYMFQGSCDRSGPWGNGKQMWVLAASDGSSTHAPAGAPLNPGTTPAERAQACGDACLAKATPIVHWSWSQNTWNGFTAKGFMVAEDAAAGGAGECWCQQAPSDPCRGMIEQNGQWVNQMPNRDYWRIASAPDAMSWLQGAARYDFT